MSRRLPIIPTILVLAAVAVMVGLGVWQLERLSWKLDLIARVNARLAADPEPLPGPAQWSRLAEADGEYRKVRVSGTFDHGHETLVQALTERGPGFWVLTPLRTEQGVVLVNRGFVPPKMREPASREAGQVRGQQTLVGLVRLSEPNGRFLRPNQPAAERWYSRDVAAIAAQRGLEQVAPFFVDADASPNPGGYPIGGLTVVSFRNAHLVYALTWFGLAALSLFGLALTWKTTHKRG
jgi:surfeit locus 1 family protein